MYIHGGGWVSGHRAFASLPLLYELSRAGFLCFTINYRLSPGVAFPDHLIDCKRAVAWIRAHAAEYGGDATWIACGGESAGGHLASLVCVDACAVSV